jgi:hypothetical protein
MTIMSQARRLYSWISGVLVACLVVFFLANGAFFVAIQFKEHFKSWVAPANPVGEKYGASLRDAYPDMTMAEINDLLVETWTRPFAYDPVVQFREGALNGRHVRVDEAGFRHSTAQGAWPPEESNYNIFVFGSSSIFGYGISDQHTVPSYLQQHLGEADGRQVKVYNFGRGLFYSTQERRLFERLLLEGTIPDAAIFIDGLSEFSHVGNGLPYTSQLGEALGSGFLSRLGWALEGMPLQRLAKWFRKRVLSRFKNKQDEPRSVAAVQSVKDSMKDWDPSRLVRRYLLNARLIEILAREYGVKYVFVWQPVSTYRVETSAVPLVKVDMGEHIYAGRAYELSRDRIEKHPAGNRFIWCADIQTGVAEPLYVDAVHYNARAASLLAGCIADQARERRLLPK